MSKTKVLKAILLADSILMELTEIPKEDIEEAINKLGQAESTWGLLWGLENINLTYKDVQIYELKRKLLLTLLEIMENPDFNNMRLVAALKRQQETT